MLNRGSSVRRQIEQRIQQRRSRPGWSRAGGARRRRLARPAASLRAAVVLNGANPVQVRGERVVADRQLPHRRARGDVQRRLRAASAARIPLLARRLQTLRPPRAQRPQRRASGRTAAEPGHHLKSRREKMSDRRHEQRRDVQHAVRRSPAPCSPAAPAARGRPAPDVERREVRQDPVQRRAPAPPPPANRRPG